MQVSSLMTANPHAIEAKSSLDLAMELMDAHNIRHLPVVEGDKLLGVVSDRDLLEATGWLHPRQLDALEVPLQTVGQLLSGDIDTVTSETDLSEALDLFVTHRIGSLPVLSESQLVGIVTETDLLRAYADGVRRAEIKRKQDRPVREFMTPEPITMAPTTGADEIAAQLFELRVHHMPIVEGDGLVGIVSDRDIRRVRGCGQLETALAKEIMTVAPQTVQSTAPLSTAALLMASERISALPVMDGKRLVGLLTTLDAIVPCAVALQEGLSD